MWNEIETPAWIKIGGTIIAIAVIAWYIVQFVISLSIIF
jgi:hypothetical protein